MLPDAQGLLVVRRDVLPAPVCLKCGGTHVTAVPVEVETTPEDSALLAAGDLVDLVMPMVGTIADAHREASRQKATLVVPLCAPCAERWAKARRATKLVAWGPFVLAVFGVAGVVLLIRAGLWGTSAKVVVGALGFAIAYVVVNTLPKIVAQRVVQPATCGAAAIAPGHVVLTRAHPAARAANAS